MAAKAAADAAAAVKGEAKDKPVIELTPTGAADASMLAEKAAEAQAEGAPSADAEVAAAEKEAAEAEAGLAAAKAEEAALAKATAATSPAPAPAAAAAPAPVAAAVGAADASRVCTSITGDANLNGWCSSNCKVGFCPTDKCACTGGAPEPPQAAALAATTAAPAAAAPANMEGRAGYGAHQKAAAPAAAAARAKECVSFAGDLNADTWCVPYPYPYPYPLSLSHPYA